MATGTDKRADRRLRALALAPWAFVALNALAAALALYGIEQE